MKQGDQNPIGKELPTPGLIGMSRKRLLSMNTPQLSPMRIIQSPFMNLGENNVFDSNLNMNNDFQLEEERIE